MKIRPSIGSWQSCLGSIDLHQPATSIICHDGTSALTATVWRFDMKCSSLFIAVSGALMLAAPSIVFGQSSNPGNATAPVTGMKPDRTTAPMGVREAMQKREAAKRQKRAECRAKAKAEKVSLLKRPAYVKKCVAQSN
jgi:hypothetical protein